MKTYLLDTFDRYKRFSENLDVRATLCNKSWWVFNDCGDKEVYIFEEDGSLHISLNGKVTNATWKYIPANKSIIISTSNQSYMVHAAFMDNLLFALQLDGTNEYSFLIEERNMSSFKSNTFFELNNYFEHKERTLLKETKRKKRILEQQKLDSMQVELEKQQKELYFQDIKQRVDAALASSLIYKRTKIIHKILSVSLTIVIVLVLYYTSPQTEVSVLLWIATGLLIFLALHFILYGLIFAHIENGIEVRLFLKFQDEKAKKK